MRPKTNREKGDALESLVSKMLDINITKGSGALNDDGDLKDANLIIECKVKNGSNSISIPSALIQKVRDQAVKWGLDWVIATQTKDKKVYVTMNIDTFAELYHKTKFGPHEDDE